MAAPRAGAKAGMRAWSTQHRIQAFPRRKKEEGGVLEQKDAEEEPDTPMGGIEPTPGEVFTLPNGQKRPKRQQLEQQCRPCAPGAEQHLWQRHAWQR